MYVHSQQPFSATRVGSGANGGPDVVAGRGAGSTGKKQGLGGTIAGIAFRGMDSMGGHHEYSMNELDTTTSTLAMNEDRKYAMSDEAAYSSKVVHGDERGIIVHSQSESIVDVDLERAQSGSRSGHGNQKSFVPEI